MDVLDLLKSKNRCLEKFIEISNEFLAQSKENIFTGLDHFESQRMATLKAYDLFDRKIHENVSSLANIKNRPEMAEAVQQELTDKQRLVQEILSIDEKIIQYLEIEKDRISMEVARAQKGKSAVQKFKSSWVPESGEELDKKL